MIAHIGLIVGDLERSREFYEHYFGAVSNVKYDNGKGFSSYFLSFPDGGARLEIMREDGKSAAFDGHVALSLADSEAVKALTERLRADGFAVLNEPRTTGDGYYESVVADPDGYRVEITC